MPNRHSPPTRRDPSTLPCMAVAPATPAKQTIRKTTPHFAPFSPLSSFTFPRQKIIVNQNVRVNYISPPPRDLGASRSFGGFPLAHPRFLREQCGLTAVPVESTLTLSLR